MYSKNILAPIFIIISALILWRFAIPYKEQAIDPISKELNEFKDARQVYADQTNIKKLEDKIASLNAKELSLLDTYVPKELNSGKAIYSLSQIANQNRLNIQNIQYAIVDDLPGNASSSRKLSVEFKFEGFYENFAAWLAQIEKSNTLIDIASVKMSKVSNSSEILEINIKLSLYGVAIQ